MQENSNSFINNNKNQIKQKTIQSNNIYINDNNNNTFQNNNDLRCDINNKNRNMNVYITYHWKINTFAPENFLENNLTNINYPPIRDNDNNNYNNYSLNQSKNIVIINNSNCNKRYNGVNRMSIWCK